MEAKISCFAYSNKNGHEGCRALTDLYCKKEDCRFYKPDHTVDMRQIEREIRAYSTKK